MRRGSFIGPILLIVLGTLFLLHNLRADLNILEFLGNYWPVLLILWGALRIAEITYWKISGKPLPRHGISGGEWTLVVLLFLIGNGLFFAHRYSDRFPSARIHMRGLEILGDTFDFPHDDKTLEAGKAPRIVIEKFTGNARIHGEDTAAVRLSGRTSVRAYNREEAQSASDKCPLELIRSGDTLIIRTNQQRASSNKRRISAELDIAVPRGASIEAQGTYGDFDISDLTGAVSIDSDNAGVRLSNIAGNISVETRRSDIVRVVNAKGNVELRGAGWDVELDTIEGQATVNGSYTGDLLFRRLVKPLRYDSPNTELRADRTTGQINLSRGDFSGSGISGPFVLKSKSKDVELYDFQGPAEISVDRGDIEIRPAAALGGKIDLRTRAGDILLQMPETGNFEVRAETRRGEIENDWPVSGATDDVSSEGRRRTLVVKAGSGPLVTALTERGTVIVRKGAAGAPPEPPAPPKAPKPPAFKGPVEEL
jgi:DUF4097 and DUF4098 domain-containing protein YvlB